MATTDRRFLRMQRRMLVTTIIGYTLFYFLRKNLSLAMPGLAQDYGITKSSLGLFLTLHGVVYGLGKFVVAQALEPANTSVLGNRAFAVSTVWTARC